MVDAAEPRRPTSANTDQSEAGIDTGQTLSSGRPIAPVARPYAATTAVPESLWPTNWPDPEADAAFGWYGAATGALESLAPVAAEYRRRLRNALAPLRTLPPDWDSYGADPVDPPTLDRATSFLSTLAIYVRSRYPRLYIVPTTDGGVSLEWQSGPKELTITFQPGSKELEVFFADPTSGREDEFYWPSSAALPWIARETTQ
jgi:hypothetical protein